MSERSTSELRPAPSLHRVHIILLRSDARFWLQALNAVYSDEMTLTLRRYFSFQPVLHDWCNKGCGMCHPVCGMMHIKELLLLIKRVAHVVAAGVLSHYLNGPVPYV